MAPPDARELAGLVDRYLGRVYQLCRRMTLDGAAADAATYDTFARVAAAQLPAGDAEREVFVLRTAAKALTPLVSAAPEVSFDLLDETLRSEATRTGEIKSLTNPEREYLLWELKQGCMTSVLNCLPAGERVAFVLSTVLRMTDEDAARVLGINESAFKVRLSRARKKVGDYLAPRCEHVDPRNPCHCPSRIGVALAKGFIAPPPVGEVSLRNNPPFQTDNRRRDSLMLYRGLPEFEPSQELRARIEASVRSGAW